MVSHAGANLFRVGGKVGSLDFEDDHTMVIMETIHSMKTITVTKAKAQFSGIARRVVRTKEPVMISTPTGMVQLIPWELPAMVEPFAAGSIRMTEEELRLANSFGESFGDGET